jgi:hypothetical protein
LTYYPLQIIDNFTFEFTTKHNIFYKAYFVDYSFILYDFPHLAQNIFSFNIDVIDGNVNDAVSDENIGVTIVEIFKLFFKK